MDEYPPDPDEVRIKIWQLLAIVLGALAWIGLAVLFRFLLGA